MELLRRFPKVRNAEFKVAEKRKKSAEEKAAKKAKKQEAGERAHQKIVAQLEHVPAAEALKADAEKAALEMRKAELLQTVSSSVASDAGRAFMEANEIKIHEKSVLRPNPC